MFINETGTLGIIILESINNLTGSLFLSLLLFVFALFMIGMILRLDVEVSIIVIMPLLIVNMAYTKEFVTIGGVALIYFGTLMAKYYFIQR